MRRPGLVRGVSEVWVAPISEGFLPQGTQGTAAWWRGAPALLYVLRGKITHGAGFWVRRTAETSDAFRVNGSAGVAK